jgi:hypothetical protein
LNRDGARRAAQGFGVLLGDPLDTFCSLAERSGCLFSLKSSIRAPPSLLGTLDGLALLSVRVLHLLHRAELIALPLRVGEHLLGNNQRPEVIVTDGVEFGDHVSNCLDDPLRAVGASITSR